jgi:preprotein translocase subunit SecD
MENRAGKENAMETQATTVVPAVPAAPARPTPLRLASAVLWSFFGVRKRRNMEADLGSLSLPQVVAAGLIGAALFVLFLVSLVRYITQ